MSVFSPMPPRLVRAALLSLICALLTLGLTNVASAATIYYVATTGSNFNTGLSWQSPKSDLNSTIHAASSGDQVWVKTGTYTGNFTGVDGVALYGGFAGTETSLSQRNIPANPTILDGNNNGTTYTETGSQGTTNYFDGFTVQHGRGGLSQTGNDVLMISNCIFTNNSLGAGAGVSGDTVIIKNCAFTSNVGNPNSAIDANDITVSDCSFSNNTGRLIFAGTGTITGSTFVSNTGAVFFDGGTPTVANCVFNGNSPSAITLFQVSSAFVKDNLIVGTGSASTDADGVDVEGNPFAYGTITNNTIINANVGINISGSGTSGAVSVANNVFYSDYGSVNDTGNPTFTSSHNDNDNNVSYYYQGVNPSSSDLLSVDPSFVNAGSGNYQLASNSPLINAGDDSYVTNGDLDLDGNPRINGNAVDIGAYEYTPSGTPVPASLAFNPASIASGAMTTATVTLTLPAPTGGAVVTLTSSNTTAAPVPASITVAAGATTATFKITAGTVTASTNVTITARYNGTSVTGTLTVAPEGIASVTLSSYTITGGDALTGSVNLLYPAAANTVVTLAPGGSDSVPASVTVKANTTSATFTIKTSAVPAKIGASVLATLNGKSVKGGFTLLPPQVSTLVIAPNAVMGGTPVSATVVLNVPAPSGGIVVNLTSSNTSEVSVPASVTVPAGSYVATFPVTTYAVTGYTRVTIDSTTTALVGAASVALLP